jgi:hypothetical protein
LQPYFGDKVGMNFYINGASITANGMINWKEACEVLTGTKSYIPSEPECVEPEILPANERRRSVKTVKLAIQVAQEAIINSEAKMENLQTVFASSMGDGLVMDGLLKALGMPKKVVLPISFHNSVHNAPVGYWLIGSKCMKASTSIACKETTFGSALMESTSQLSVESEEILLVVYDLKAPEPLHYAMPIEGIFATAMVLSRKRRKSSIAFVELTTVTNYENKPSAMDNIDLEAIRTGNPAARSLPMLFSLANGSDNEIMIEYTKDTLLCLNIKPCL